MQVKPSYASVETFGSGTFEVPVVSLRRLSPDTFNLIAYIAPLTDAVVIPFTDPEGTFLLCDCSEKYPGTAVKAGSQSFDCCECFEPSTVTGTLLPAHYLKADGVRCCGKTIKFKGKAPSVPLLVGYSKLGGGIGGLPGIPISNKTFTLGLIGSDLDELAYYAPPTGINSFVDIAMYLSRQHGFEMDLDYALKQQINLALSLFSFAGTFTNYDPLQYLDDVCWEHGLVLKQSPQLRLSFVEGLKADSIILTSANCDTIIIEQNTTELNDSVASFYEPICQQKLTGLDDKLLEFVSTQNSVQMSKIVDWTKAASKPYYRAQLTTRDLTKSDIYLLAMPEMLGLGEYAGAYSDNFELIIITDSFVLNRTNTVTGTYDFTEYGVVPGDVATDSTGQVYQITGVSGLTLTLDREPQNSGMRILDNTVTGDCLGSLNEVIPYTVADGKLTLNKPVGTEFVITKKPIYCFPDSEMNTEISSSERVLTLTEYYVIK
ncbi:MAG: hypothetical protein ACRCZ9_08100 [Fusobacteriaceae bacterium]